MSETLNAQDIAKKLQEQLTSLSATVDTHERHGRRASGVQELRYR